MIVKIVSIVFIIYLIYKIGSKTKIIDIIKLQKQKIDKSLKDRSDYDSDINRTCKHNSKLYKLDDEL